MTMPTSSLIDPNLKRRDVSPLRMDIIEKETRPAKNTRNESFSKDVYIRDLERLQKERDERNEYLWKENDFLLKNKLDSGSNDPILFRRVEEPDKSTDKMYDKENKHGNSISSLSSAKNLKYDKNLNKQRDTPTSIKSLDMMSGNTDLNSGPTSERRDDYVI